MKKLTLTYSLALCFSFLFSSFAFGTSKVVWDYEKEVKKVERDFRSDKIDRKSHAALNFLIVRAILELRFQGHSEEADQLRDEWKNQNTKFFAKGFGTLDLGDWEAMNEWLVEVHDNLSDKLSEKIMKLTRLNDIKTFNYGIPVVFSPEDPRWDVDEYRLHFVPFTGAVSYWATWGACSMGTTGILAMIGCPVAGTLAEKVTVKYVAPKLSDRAYERGQE
jgi:hypothetical protein